MKAFAELESSLAALHKTLYISSHDQALERFLDLDHDVDTLERLMGERFRRRKVDESETGYFNAIEKWLEVYSGPVFAFYCIEICDHCCDNASCNCRDSWKLGEEWGLTAFGNSVTEALESLVSMLDEYHKMDFKHL